jgi:hypothetical protein
LELNDPKIANDSLIIAGFLIEGLKEDVDSILRKVPLGPGQKILISDAGFSQTREKVCKSGKYFLQTINVRSDKGRKFAWITLTYVKRR